MRKILFRGKRTDTGKWVEGYFLVAAGMTFISVFGAVLPIQVNCETVGQYTGLTDRNGKKIFEGDILQNELSYVYSGQYKSTVVFETGKFYGNGFFDFEPSDFKYCEVIGNIHDNPELLEVQN